VPRSRTLAIQPPEELGEHDGLAYALFLPPAAPAGGVVVLHGASSSKESHYDFARAARAQGLAAIVFDQRGHGASSGDLDGRAVADIGTMAALLPAGPLALRGSSMGGYFALIAAETVGARAVVAICAAGSDGFRRSLRRGELHFRADPGALDALLSEHDPLDAVTTLDAALLLLHAEGDEVVPVAHSRALIEAARSPVKRLLAVPGGHHRSIQHDPELQAYSLRFIARALAES
jgi:alpha-beta hydrolase superfamily lysophospholipase